MSDSKTYVFGGNGDNGGVGNNALAWLAPMLSQKGVDPNVLLAMNNRNGGSWGMDFIWVIFLMYMMNNGMFGGWGNNRGGNFGGYGGGVVAGDAALANMINNNDGRNQLREAISGNATAIQQLSSTLGCSIGQVQAAINGVMGQVQAVGNQVGQSSLQIINAIQAGNTTLAQQLAECCCEQRLATCQQTNALQNTMTANTQSLRDATNAQTQAILAKLDAAETRALQDKIDALREENGTYKSSAMTSTIVNNAVAPLIAGQADFNNRLAKIECKQPETVTVPYSPITPVPNCVAYGLGIYGGLPYGGFPSGGFWG